MKITKDENGITFDGEHRTILFPIRGKGELKLEGFSSEQRINIMNFISYDSDIDGEDQMELALKYLSRKKWYQFWK
jgi:hypothetical protein